MAWIIKIDGLEVASDDFTIDELDRIEKETGGFWSTLNPLREAKIAKAFLRLALEKTGRDPDDVSTFTLGQIKTMFDFREDEIPGVDKARPTKARKGQTRRGSSKPSQTSTDGLPASQGSSGSET